MPDDILLGYLAASHADGPQVLQRQLPENWRVVPLLPADLADAGKLAPLRYLLVAGCKVTDADLARMPGLRVLHKLGVGYDDIDRASLAQRGIALCNCPLGSAEAVAEHALALALAALKALSDLDRAVRERKEWPKWQVRTRLRQLRGQTVGIVGYGPIGQEAARLFAAFGAKLLVHTRTPIALPEGFEHVAALEALFARSDIVSLHVPLNDHSRAMVRAAHLRALGPEGLLISTARGQVVDQEALVHCLSDGTLGFAALDVLEQEPPAPDAPILRAPNVLITPHIGGGGDDVIHRKLAFIARNLVAIARGAPAKNLIAPMAVPPGGPSCG